jgi:hypothetical protein
MEIDATFRCDENGMQVTKHNITNIIENPSLSYYNSPATDFASLPRTNGKLTPGYAAVTVYYWNGTDAVGDYVKIYVKNNEAAIRTFYIGQLALSGVINASAHTVAISGIPSNTDDDTIKGLKPYIKLAEIAGQKYHARIADGIGSSVTALSGGIVAAMTTTWSTTTAAPNTFNAGYTITAEDDTAVTWNITLSRIARNSEAKILEFKIPSLNREADTIDNTASTVHIWVPNGTILSKIDPTITVSVGATLSAPIVQSSVDTKRILKYTVKAESEATQNWIVTIEMED